MLQLVIRADASSRIGSGHIMRMIALAQAWQDRGGTVTFAVRDCPDGLIERLESEDCRVHWVENAKVGSVEDADTTVAIAHQCNAKWVVLDGYDFGPEFQSRILRARFQVFLLDDYGHHERYVAHFVLNQNIGANEHLYPHTSQHTNLLLGLRYVLLRREFQLAAGKGVEGSIEPERLLVTVGGADPSNAMGKIVEVLNLVVNTQFHVRLVIGPGFGELGFHEAMRQSHHRIDLIQCPDDMPAQYQWADAVITAAGSTVWECLALEVPFFTITLAENQAGNAIFLAEEGLAPSLGIPDDDSFETNLQNAIYGWLAKPTEPLERAKRGSQLIDGKGATRVVESIA